MFRARNCLAAMVLGIVTVASGRAALIGIDFNVSPGGSAPANWSQLTATNDMPARTTTPLTINNLIDESGTSTAVDYTLDSSVGKLRAYSNSLLPSTVPSHGNSLARLGGYFHNDTEADDTVTSTFSDLRPDTPHRVWVFGTRIAGFDNEVTIKGAGTPISFSQIGDTGQLFVNETLGDSARDLASFAKIVSSTSSGTIQISWTEGPSATRYAIAGVALEEIPEPSTLLLLGMAAAGLLAHARRRRRRLA